MRAEPQNPTHRGSGWPRLAVARQGDPAGVLRAALTRRSFVARPFANSLGRFAMCSIATCLILATLGNAPTAAQQSETHRLLAETLDLTQSPAASLQLQIWSDKLPEIAAKRRQLQDTVPSLHLKLIAEVFTTSFKDGDRTIIVSSLNEDCASSQVAPNEGDCPARVAEVRNGKLRILKNLSEFPVSALRGEAGYDASTNKNTQYMTLLTFNPTSQQITTKIVYGGETGERAPIDLK
ncbi:hypothetical protein [Methylocystis echinoides]|jgi:hypothetical protein|uniref:Uncharacterized protein n=1 Tax=Methylocystis echinoides TaxID=29468 RepID=A0A9W6GZ58_9HYPH|nr:hypothetical protein [Methylocystis echinoides]GLI95788.1 hypothetical protein LMG27198_47800 [Methylocystis echinoides]